MPLTGQLGTVFSQPGTLQAGFAIVQNKVQWLGPWYGTCPDPTVRGAKPGTVLTVSLQTAQNLVNSDPAWWFTH